MHFNKHESFQRVFKSRACSSSKITIQTLFGVQTNLLSLSTPLISFPFPSLSSPSLSSPVHSSPPLKSLHFSSLPQIRSLEDTLSDTEMRYNNEISRLNKILLQLEADLTKVRSQVERQVEDYQDLLHVKMKLEAEIENYHRLILGISDDKEAR